jgi:hypothetical protein
MTGKLTRRGAITQLATDAGSVEAVKTDIGSRRRLFQQSRGVGGGGRGSCAGSARGQV